MLGTNIKAFHLAVFVIGSCHRISAQTASREIDQEIVEESVLSIGTLIAREYFARARQCHSSPGFLPKGTSTLRCAVAFIDGIWKREPG